ncbi:long-chain fatty acid-CoA ligase, partial [Spiromyces aspiralis]
DIKKVVNGEEVSQKKQWQYFKLSQYKWVKYKDIKDFAIRLGSGLRCLGLNKDDRLLICAPTSKEWMMTAFACSTQSLQIVTAYDTLGEDGLHSAAHSSAVSAFFLKADKLPVAARIAKDTPSLKHVIYYIGGDDEQGEGAYHSALEQLRAANVQTHLLHDVLDLGKQNPFEPVPPKPDDIALIMFTSGSTGNPKGALISHKNIVSVAGSIDLVIKDYIVHQDEVLLCYLPLAHILELMVEIYILTIGSRLGYGTVKTLTNDNVRGCDGDLVALKPTVMIGVPMVWDSIRAGIQRKVKAKGSVAGSVFRAAVAAKSLLRKAGLPHRFLNFVFKEVTKVTGGRLKFIITGGAPISDYTQQFLSAALCPMIQGYGMTEVSGLVSVQTPDDPTLKAVGPPVPSVEAKLVDVEEMGYYAKNNQGEIWLRGPSIFQGYLNNEEETKKVLTEDGWLRTGDIAQWLPNSELAIIDRLKNLVKLAQGEYLALEKLESIYKMSLFVDNICICAHSELYQPVAIILPNHAALTNWANEQGIKYNHDDYSELVNLPETKQAVLGDLLAIAKRKQLAKFESLADIILDDGEWTPENGMVTAAAKLKRREIERRHAEALKAIYSKAK